MKKGKILVVDDNAGIRATLKLLLPAHFAEVELLPSPVSLVSKMDAFRPDVVLLDMNFHTVWVKGLFLILMAVFGFMNCLI